MTPISDNASEIIQEAEDLLQEVIVDNESFDAEVTQPLQQVSVAVDNAQASFDDQEEELIDLNEAYLDKNEEAVAQAAAQANVLLTEDEEESAG